MTQVLTSIAASWTGSHSIPLLVVPFAPDESSRCPLSVRSSRSRGTKAKRSSPRGWIIWEEQEEHDGPEDSDGDSDDVPMGRF
jgi:hypothetical protein